MNYTRISGFYSGDYAEGYRDGRFVVVHIQIQGHAPELFEIETNELVEDVVSREFIERLFK